MAVPREITRIEVPEPEPMHLTPDGGAETQGAAYRLSAPAVATEPLTVTAPDGTALTWVPTELCYRDESGQMDYIVGSAPATVQVRGHEARYQRTFPVADDVFRAEAERVKHWVILHEPPRPPAEYLSGAIEFGVTGLVSGVTLPEGRHDEIEAGPFRLPKPVARDLAGKEIAGYYEVVPAEGGQQVFVWFPADGILDAVYPVTIDPTVTASGYYYATSAGNHGVARAPDGSYYVAVVKPEAPYLFVYRSVDRGQTWSDIGCPGLSAANAYFAIVATDDGRVHVLAGEGSNVVHLIYNGQVWTKQTATPVSGGYLFGLTAAAYGNNVYLAYISASGATGYSLWFARYNGTSWSSSTKISVPETWMRWCFMVASGSTIAIIYTGNTNQSNVYQTLSAVSLNGGSSFAQYTIDATNDGEFVAACATGSGDIYAVYSIENPDFTYEIRCVRWTGSGWGQKTSVRTGIAYMGSLKCLGYGNSDIYVVWSGQSADGSYFYVSYRAFVNSTWEPTSTLSAGNENRRYVCVPQAVPDQMDIPVVWTEGNAQPYTVRCEQIDREDPPDAPILGQRRNFDANDDAVFSWTFSDPDLGDEQSAYQLVVRRASDSATVYDTGKVASTAQQHTLPGGTLQNGVQYRWTVRTWDSMDLVGPYATEQSFLTSARPTVTITDPATDGATVATAEYTIQWSVSDPESKGQSAYRVVLKQGSTVVHDSSQVQSTTARSYTLTGLQNNTSYAVEVTAWDGDGVASQPATRTIRVQYTPPPEPTVTVEGLDGRVRLRVDNHNDGATIPAERNDVYRRRAGETGSGIRIAAGVPPDGVVEDYAVASGVAYEYRVVAFGGNGTSAASVWTPAPVLSLRGAWLHDPADPAGTVRSYRVAAQPERGEDWEPERALLQFAGRTYPVAEFGEAEDRLVRFSVLVRPDRLDELEALRALAARRSVVCYRDSAGRRIYGVLGPLRIRDERHGGYTVDLEITAVDYDEAV